jgi:uncharacterized protein YfkK (UPF0435 family)
MKEEMKEELKGVYYFVIKRERFRLYEGAGVQATYCSRA